MVRTVTAKTRKIIVGAAQDGAQKIRAVVADAASAATQAAAGVVLASTANALEAGRTQLTQSTPGVKKTLGRAAKRTIGGRQGTSSGRKGTAKKVIARRKTAHRKRTAERRPR